ncbi:patatin-like phospholipase family protein [Phaeocystidibacter luteus]|uniref:Phospholipase n=1 Tax=Phaeocystidibacter luteus TaxID=911197 RepID=A0A6N6RMD0_9FLAO|nr:patatin-like phospholipase family protein [Phaeocystidibacter luteus]KAB2814715.1 phospholipase [Phaeocystidibacter luteus]
MSDSTKKNVALVLGSGGARGLAHIGVIEALEERGYKITSISGASIGAVIAGVYAAGSMEDYKKWIISLDRRKVFGLMDFTLSSHGFIKGERVFEEMKRFVGVEKIEDLKIPFSAVAVDLENQEEVVFTEGDLWSAIRASVAIPSVLTPVMQDNRILVDGGVVNPLPVNRVKRTDDDIMVAVDLNALVDDELPMANPKSQPTEDKEQNKFLESIKDRIGDWWPFNGESEKDTSHVKKNYLGILNASFEMMQDRVAQLAMEQFKPEIFIQIPRKSASTFDFYLGEKLIDAGRTLAMKAIDEFENNQ